MSLTLVIGGLLVTDRVPLAKSQGLSQLQGLSRSLTEPA